MPIWANAYIYLKYLRIIGLDFRKARQLDYQLLVEDSSFSVSFPSSVSLSPVPALFVCLRLCLCLSSERVLKH